MSRSFYGSASVCIYRGANVIMFRQADDMREDWRALTFNLSIQKNVHACLSLPDKKGLSSLRPHQLMM